MRPMFAGFTLALVMLATAHGVWASIYVPGHVRDGVYIRPHFVSAPNAAFGPNGGPKVTPPAADQTMPPLLDVVPAPTDRKLGEQS
jgi:hypothetical protein